MLSLHVIFVDGSKGILSNSPKSVTPSNSSISNASANASSGSQTQSNHMGMKLKKLCFSSATTPAIFQSSLEAELDKRGG